jgi:hypothetical protein
VFLGAEACEHLAQHVVDVAEEICKGVPILVHNLLKKLQEVGHEKFFDFYDETAPIVRKRTMHGTEMGAAVDYFATKIDNLPPNDKEVLSAMAAFNEPMTEADIVAILDGVQTSTYL